MENLFTLSNDPNGIAEVEEWLSGEPQYLYAIAREWFGKFRDCGTDVECQLHDGYPTATVRDAALGYVNVFKSHINVGFFTGAWLDDPHTLLEGSGKRMRHVKLWPDKPVNQQALEELISNAYRDLKSRL